MLLLTALKMCQTRYRNAEARLTPNPAAGPPRCCLGFEVRMQIHPHPIVAPKKARDVMTKSCDKLIAPHTAPGLVRCRRKLIGRPLTRLALPLAVSPVGADPSVMSVVLH